LLSGGGLVRRGARAHPLEGPLTLLCSFCIPPPLPQVSCAGGSYSPSSGASSCTPCEPGYFCVSGATAQQVCGAVGVYCPANSSSPLTVGVGNYSLPLNASATLRSAQAPCPAGFFCTGGLRSPCDIGTFANTTGTVDVCLRCPVGTLCLSNGTVNAVRLVARGWCVWLHGDGPSGQCGLLCAPHPRRERAHFPT
jgi:hypothetical protein